MDGKGVGGGGGAKGGGSDGGKVGGVGVQSGGDNSSKGSGSDAGKMVAPGTGGASQISRDSFESNPKGYFSALHANEKANEKGNK
ncbi:uncharacterized protein LOC126694975 [Quercus robur]|uniref:uncharacterized protein LOC126694975 n=1 Tax=Quercus robur TaxID=38942 RepID=UPI0021632F3D|nr:uncharacterized protein LOC126694975 [Quercus robur]